VWLEEIIEAACRFGALCVRREGLPLPIEHVLEQVKRERCGRSGFVE
jgi:hypothetical protein